IQNLQTGDFWLFTADAGGQLYLAISSDSCATWGSFSTIESNVCGLSAEAGTGGRMYAAYRDMVTDNVKVLTFTDPSTWTSSIVGPAGSDASPVVAAETAGSENVGVTYHDATGNVVLAISTDYASSWTTNDYGDGIYPFLDAKNGASDAAICFGDTSNDEILVASAPSMSELLLQTAIAVTDRAPFLGGPSVIRYLPSDVGMLYMVPTAGNQPRDLWIDCESFVGVAEGSSLPIATSFEVGPNPCTGALSIRFELASPQRAEVQIYSTDGRLVEEVFSGTTSGQTLQVDPGLPAGVYAVTLRTEAGISTRRIVSL
ncbi:T9SS type A sorting domain-containing protein, partial [Candidatus Fermentibacteria bacterium]|nr:T9SS type A sorting domain-containing protein [Candidatus Fermentibacteria bacterium]